jgi:hypothetical protein
LYAFVLNWKNSVTISRRDMTTEVLVRPRFRFVLRRSAAVSPTVVQRILMTQK